MTEEQTVNHPEEAAVQEEQEQTAAGQTDTEEEAYGWEFHKMPFLVAVALTVLFYCFVYFYVKY